jgi:methylenetetrahydrofolate dehydrogenase (NADP+)/methenyltetrahydrofolate cyclohydrolase
VTAQLLDGRPVVAAIRAATAASAADVHARHGVAPCLAVVSAGDDPSVQSYVRAIERAAGRVGVTCRQVVLDVSAGDSGARHAVGILNRDPSVHGVIAMFPLPPPLSQSAVAEILVPEKDVDGITPANLGRLAQRRPAFVPSTPLGGIELLRHYEVDVAGLEATVVGRSAVVGMPRAMLLTNLNATVTVCHTGTRDLRSACRRADLLVAATDRAHMFAGDMIKPGAIVVDFGTVPAPDGRLLGNVDFRTARNVAAWITPETGGTGPVTTAILLRQTVEAARALLTGS